MILPITEWDAAVIDSLMIKTDAFSPLVEEITRAKRKLEQETIQRELAHRLHAAVLWQPVVR